MIPRTAPGGFHWWCLRFQWAVALSLSAVFTEIPRWWLGIAASAGICGAWMDRAAVPRPSVERFAAPASGFLLAAAAADFLWGSRDLLSSAILLVLGLQSVKFLLPKERRDEWQLCGAAFLEFLASAAEADSPAFAAGAFLFFTASVGALSSLHHRESEESGRPREGYTVPVRTAASALLLAGVAGILSCALLFAVIPRLEYGKWLRRFGRTPKAPGFSETITLHEVTGGKSDRTVVARVEFPDPRSGQGTQWLYLRGAAYSIYDNGRWRRAADSVRPLPRSGFVHIAGVPSDADSTADITLEPADHPALFTFGTPSWIEGAFGPLLTDGDGNLSFPVPEHATVRYRIRFADPPRRAAGHPSPGGETLAFPEGEEEIRRLAAEWAGEAGTDAERADRIARRFRSGFRYTLTDPAANVRDFLFRRRAGHCGHFAAALALLLRAAGIPSRVAAGYLGGEWNAFGGYRIVRQADAHAWVEAWIGGRWTRMDATPAVDASSLFRNRTNTFGLWLDWLRQRWNRYVVNYSLRMQADALRVGFRTLQRAGGALRPRALDGSLRNARSAVAGAALSAGILLAVLHLLRSRRSRRGNASPRVDVAVPRPYVRLVRRLERCRFLRVPGEPIEEALRAAVRSAPELSGDADAFVRLYHRDRFGAVPLPPRVRKEAFHLAARLRRGIPSERKPRS